MRTVLRTAPALIFLCFLTAAAGATTQEKPINLPAFPVTQVEMMEIPITYTVPGSVVSDGRIDVSSRVVGFIEQLDVREGQKVSRGDLLVRIDQTDIDEAVRQAEAGVRASQKDLDDAEQDVEKFARLTQSGTVAAETLRKAKVRVDIARANLDKARAALNSAEAQKSYATVTSPVDGVIVSVARRSGEMATAGSTIMTVESREVLLFKTFVSESNLSAIDPQTPVTVRIDTLKGEVFQGRIRGIVPSGDDVTRRYEVNIVLPSDPRLVPGMFGRAEIVLGKQFVTLIPQVALVRRGGLDGVFVLDGDVARFRWLRTGRVWGDAVEVVSGLSGGETILAAANDTIRDGSVVQTAEEAR
ncbi:efflux RND transporter periplasmic adaptor subunit [Pseudochelatococcus contaminans]|uniref:RND family efflux transporter MFP subunit n=1 Tax=Pseudochelatococcus contaminans TaxID=1538103 RepID=A0A7W5Z6H3_9HYPH|nr:efflux RND transporter periplasmic adaptor subunit [Pseudochelatococcus contaminans]MBB3810376.1 RND family efflux transporter MFP subunit [Pseudochelatococcus contaminans]